MFRNSLILAAVLLCASIALGEAFTYQGRLHAEGSGAEGDYDFQFQLFGSEEGGSQIGGTVAADAMKVSGGYFTADVDFGSSSVFFNGSPRWLGIAVRRSGSGETFTTLTPRQQITSVPVAQYALDAPDSDTLAALHCAPGQVAKWNGSAWVCGEDQTETTPDPDPKTEPVEYGNWTVVSLAKRDENLQQLVLDAASRGSAFDGSLVYLDMTGSEARRIDFFDAEVVSYEATNLNSDGQGQLLDETLEFSVGRVELSFTEVPSGQLRSKLFSNNYRFELGSIGQVAAMRVHPGAIVFNIPEARYLEQVPRLPQYPSSGGLGDQYYKSYDFMVEMSSSPEADMGWHSLSGVKLEFERDQRQLLGLRFGDVTLSGAFTNQRERKAFTDWLIDWIEKANEHINISVTVLDRDGIDAMTINYLDVAPVAYYPPSVYASEDDVELQEAVVFRATQIE